MADLPVRFRVDHDAGFSVQRSEVVGDTAHDTEKKLKSFFNDYPGDMSAPPFCSPSHEAPERVVLPVHEMGYENHFGVLTAERQAHSATKSQHEELMASVRELVTETKAANRRADRAETHLGYIIFTAELVKCFTRLAARELKLPEGVTSFRVAGLTYKLREDVEVHSVPASDASRRLQDIVQAQATLTAFDQGNWRLVRGRNETAHRLYRGTFSSHAAVATFFTKAERSGSSHVMDARRVYAILRALNPGETPEEVMVGADFYGTISNPQ